jgi:hypothetical protein
MKFYQKYPQLQQKQFLENLLIDTVFSTMALENQQVAKPQIAILVEKILNEKALKGGQFFSN